MWAALMTEVFNRRSEKELRQRLRRDMPRAEILLWSKLRGRQLSGCKFRRQYSVGPYVLDFYCPEFKLAVELDGDSHFGDGAERRAVARQAYLESFGIQFMRFTNADVFRNLEEVLETIATGIASRTDANLNPETDAIFSKVL